MLQRKAEAERPDTVERAENHRAEEKGGQAKRFQGLASMWSAAVIAFCTWSTSFGAMSQH